MMHLHVHIFIVTIGAIEEILCDHRDVAEAAVVGVKNKLRGQIPLGLLVLNSNVDKDENFIVQVIVNSTDIVYSFDHKFYVIHF